MCVQYFLPLTHQICSYANFQFLFSTDNDDVTDKDTQIPLVTTPGADRLLSSTVITVQDELLTARSQRSNDGCDPPVCNGTHQE